MGLEPVEFVRQARRPGSRQILPLDKLHQQITERAFERADRAELAFRNRYADVAQELELVDFVGVRTVDPMRGDLQDRLLIVLGAKTKSGVDAPAVEWGDLVQLGRRPRPFADDLPQRLP